MFTIVQTRTYVSHNKSHRNSLPMWLPYPLSIRFEQFIRNNEIRKVFKPNFPILCILPSVSFCSLPPGFSNKICHIDLSFPLFGIASSVGIRPSRSITVVSSVVLEFTKSHVNYPNIRSSNLTKWATLLDNSR